MASVAAYRELVVARAGGDANTAAYSKVHPASRSMLSMLFRAR
jgi:hypothetical protein